MRQASALVMLWAGATAGAATLELPAGTRLEIRLKTKVASNASKAGQAVEAVLVAPVVVAGQIVAPPGSVVKGQVKAARAWVKGGQQAAKPATGSGKAGDAEEKPKIQPEEPASLDLEFSQLGAAKIVAKVVEVDNARESVDENGTIRGVKASETLTAQMDRGLEMLGGRAGVFGDWLRTAKEAILKPADVDIVCDPGVELTLELTKPVAVEPAAGPAPAAITNETALGEMVNRQPFQTTAEKPPLPSDITNLMFLGSEQALEASFTAAGWTTAAALSGASKLETFKAIAENRGYKEAPMSILLLEGQKPDLVFQKQYNTFAKRHHLRIWRRPQTFQGRPVWVCAATHDTGIEFSPENKTFIHKIDSEIDRERAKVVSDLVFTGQVKGLALVERPEVPRQSRNATGDELITDGAMAVLLLE